MSKQAVCSGINKKESKMDKLVQVLNKRGIKAAVVKKVKVY